MILKSHFTLKDYNHNLNRPPTYKVFPSNFITLSKVKFIKRVIAESCRTNLQSSKLDLRKVTTSCVFLLNLLRLSYILVTMSFQSIGTYVIKILK